MLNTLKFTLVTTISILVAIIIYPFLVQLSFFLEKMQLLHDFYDSEMMLSFSSKVFFIIGFFILSCLLFKEKTFDILKTHFMYILIGFGIGITVILLQTLIKSAHIAYQIDFEYYGFVYIVYLSFVLKKKKAISKPKIT